MRKMLVTAVLLMLLPVVGPAVGKAQSVPKGEVFGGYAYSRIEGVNFNGWNVNVAGNLNEHLGIVVEAAGGYGKDSFTSVLGDTSIDTSAHTIMIGPRITDRSTKMFTPFVHVLMGYARINEEITNVGNAATSFQFSGGVNGFGLVAGGGVDIGNEGKFTYRLIQFDYFLLRGQESRKVQGARISTGFVLRLGERAQ